MAEHPAHLPASGPLHAIRGDYPAFPAPWEASQEAQLRHLLGRIDVSVVSAVTYHCRPGWSIPPRRIADDMFFLVLGGQGGMRVEGRTWPLGPGDLAHWRHGRDHAAWHDQRRPLRVIALHYTALVEGAVPFGDAIGIPDRIALGRGHACAHMIHACAREYALRPPGWRAGLEAAVVRILLEVLRACPDRLAIAASAGNASLARLGPALAAMRAQLADPLPLPILAKRCGLSVAQFRRLFQRALACSPLAHLRRMRLAEACRLLRQSDATIAEVAARVGYAEQAFFARSFRAALGMPPGRWRRSVQI